MDYKGHMAANITAENARKCQQLAVIARRQAAEQRRIAQVELEIAAIAEQLPEYVARRLSRVREQLDRVDQMMMDESDPQKLDRLASAQSRLSEQERILAGRPLPGSRKPAAERTSRRPALAEPVPESTHIPTPSQEPNG